MNFTSVTLLALASMLTTAAIAQDGGGHGPPHAPIIAIPQMPVPMPIPTSPTGTVQKFFQSQSGLAPATR
jgi:hypothetical protein